MIVPLNYREKGEGLHVAVVKAGHTLHYSNGVWVCSDVAAVQAIIDDYPLSSTQDEIKDAIDRYARALRDKVVAGVSPGEMASWPIKRLEAAAYASSGLDIDAPMLSAEAVSRGVPLSALVGRVAANSAALSALESAIAGTAGKHRDAVDSLDTFENVISYNWSIGWPD